MEDNAFSTNDPPQASLPPKDSGSIGESQIWQCSDPNCGFRFPLLLHPKTIEASKRQCPRCGMNANLVPQNLLQNTRQEQSINPDIAIHPVEILLDNIRSTFNVGAMFRSADGAGARHIHLCGTTPTPKHPKISKTALGAEHSVPWSYHPNAVTALQNIKNQHQSHAALQIWALEGSPSSENLFEVITHPLPEAPILLIAGNEVTGVDPGLLDMCDKIVAIPMLGYKRSLNVAIAFGIAIYSLCITAPLITKNRRAG